MLRMIERREDLRFALKRASRSGSAGRRLGQNLERDVAIQLRVARAIDLAHPAGAEQRDDLVVAEPGSSREGHTASITSLLKQANPS